MRLLPLCFSTLCFVLSVICLWFSTVIFKAEDDSLYWLPLSEVRLETKLRASLSATPNEIINLASPLAERDPRNAVARSALAQAHLTNGNTFALESHLFPLFNLIKTDNDFLIPVLVELSTDPKIFDIITDHIRIKKPSWGIKYLNQLLKEFPLSLPEFQELYTYYPNHLDAFYIHLLNRNGLAYAHDVFNQISPEHDLGGGLIIDPDFTQKNFQWPFGWFLDKASVVREPQGGLSLTYFGKGTPKLFEQITKVQEGSYRATISLSGEASRSKGYYAMRINCWKGAQIADLIIDDISSQTKVLNLDFQIKDQSCLFIQLQFLGQAGNFPSPVRTNINEVQIVSTDSTKAQ